MVLLASEYDKSRFLNAEVLKGERKFRIKTATPEVIGTGVDKEKKLVVWFTNDDRGLVLNKTNNRVLRGAFGDDTAGWAGKIIIIFSMMVEMRGQMKLGLRVRIPPPKQAEKATAAKPPQPSGNGQTVAAKSPLKNDDLNDPIEAPTALGGADDDLDDEIEF